MHSFAISNLHTWSKEQRKIELLFYIKNKIEVLSFRPQTLQVKRFKIRFYIIGLFIKL